MATRGCLLVFCVEKDRKGINNDEKAKGTASHCSCLFQRYILRKTGKSDENLSQDTTWVRVLMMVSEPQKLNMRRSAPRPQLFVSVRLQDQRPQPPKKSALGSNPDDEGFSNLEIKQNKKAPRPR